MQILGPLVAAYLVHGHGLTSAQTRRVPNVCLAILQAVAAAALLVALKLHNSPNPIQYLAHVFASTCNERLSKQQRSRELIEGFKHLRSRGLDKTSFNSAWKVRCSLLLTILRNCAKGLITVTALMQKLVEDFVSAMRVAERKVLCTTGFKNLADMSWEWNMLSKIETQLRLRNEPKWLSQEDQCEMSIDPLSTVKCVESPNAQVHLSGRQLAEQFLINRHDLYFNLSVCRVLCTTDFDLCQCSSWTH